VTQLVGGALLLFRKTAVLGAAAMLPMIANILMINLFFLIAVGAECTAAIKPSARRRLQSRIFSKSPSS
jgi:hypothetical protein